MAEEASSEREGREDEEGEERGTRREPVSHAMAAGSEVGEVGDIPGAGWRESRERIAALSWPTAGTIGRERRGSGEAMAVGGGGAGALCFIPNTPPPSDPPAVRRRGHSNCSRAPSTRCPWQNPFEPSSHPLLRFHPDHSSLPKQPRPPTLPALLPTPAFPPPSLPVVHPIRAYSSPDTPASTDDRPPPPPPSHILQPLSTHRSRSGKLPATSSSHKECIHNICGKHGTTRPGPALSPPLLVFVVPPTDHWLSASAPRSTCPRRIHGRPLCPANSRRPQPQPAPRASSHTTPARTSADSHSG